MSDQANATTEAIKSAGGVAVVALGIKESLLVGGHYWLVAPDADELAAIEAGSALVGAIDEMLSRLGEASGGGKMAASLAADRTFAVAALGASRSARDGRIMARISEVVALAASGDEPAKAAIEAVARANPKAFAADFAKALMQASEGNTDGD
jgi:hypothetical protein